MAEVNQKMDWKVNTQFKAAFVQIVYDNCINSDYPAKHVMAGKYVNNFGEQIKARTIDLWGGRGRGGSHTMTQIALFKMLNNKYFRGFLMRNVLDQVRDSLWRDFKDRINEQSELNDVDLIKEFGINDSTMTAVYRRNGNIISAKGFQKSSHAQTSRLKSLAGATDLFIEEADEVGKDDYDQVDLSLRTVKGAGIHVYRSFNPPGKNHWIWDDYNLIEAEPGYYKAVPKSDRSLMSLFGTYKHNLKNLNQSTIDKMEAYGRSLNQRDLEYYNTIVLGRISEGARGRIYRGWKPCTKDQFDQADGKKFYVMDFGYSADPTALIEIKIKGSQVWVNELLYQSGLDNIATARELIRLGITPQQVIIADPGAGGDVRIAELRRGWEIEGLKSGFYILCAIKGPGSIQAGINMLQGYEVFMTESSVNGWREYQDYRWALDKDKNPTNEPKEGNDHLMDCIRMGVLNKSKI